METGFVDEGTATFRLAMIDAILIILQIAPFGMAVSYNRCIRLYNKLLPHKAKVLRKQLEAVKMKLNAAKKEGEGGTSTGGESARGAKSGEITVQADAHEYALNVEEGGVAPAPAPTAEDSAGTMSGEVRSRM